MEVVRLKSSLGSRGTGLHGFQVRMPIVEALVFSQLLQAALIQDGHPMDRPSSPGLGLTSPTTLSGLPGSRICKPSSARHWPPSLTTSRKWPHLRAAAPRC